MFRRIKTRTRQIFTFGLLADLLHLYSLMYTFFFFFKPAVSLKSSVKQTTIPIENYSSAFQSTRDKTSCLVNLVNIWSENDSAILRFAASSFSKRERLIARLIKNKKQILGAASTRSFYFRTFEIAFNLFSFKINLKKSVCNYSRSSSSSSLLSFNWEMLLWCNAKWDCSEYQ